DVVGPAPRGLHVGALGGSVGNAEGGLTAEVVEANSFEEIKALGATAKGKIVLINKPVVRNSQGEGYSAVVPLRHGGAVAAARLGAADALIRSVGTGAYRLTHPGMTAYEEGVARMPLAARAAGDAER